MAPAESNNRVAVGRSKAEMSPPARQSKLQKLVSILKPWDSLAVAFSGGVDSSFLLAVAHDTLGDRVVAVTAESPLHPQRERHAAAEFARSLGVEHIVLQSAELYRPEFIANRQDRCYICKKLVLGDIMALTARMGFSRVAHGANVDDLGDFRPGHKAAEELGVLAPLVDAGLNKEDIRRLSRARNLNTWDKPSMACLASRIPYGTPISREALGMVEAAEDWILSFGFRTCRTRHHGRIARIEIDPRDLRLMLNETVRKKIVDRLRQIGFLHITLDLEGYVQGSLNRDL